VPRQFERSDWIEESDRQEQQIVVAGDCQRYIRNRPSRETLAIAGQCILGGTPESVVGLQLVAIAPQAVKRIETMK
jgi:hypothetical protein